MKRAEAIDRLKRLERAHQRMAPHVGHQFYGEFAANAQAQRMALEALEGGHFSRAVRTAWAAVRRYALAARARLARNAAQEA